MSEQFRQTRQSSGVTITQLAQEASVSRTTIEKVERGEPVRYEYAARIIRALNSLAGTSYSVEQLNITTSR